MQINTLTTQQLIFVIFLAVTSQILIIIFIAFFQYRSSFKKTKSSLNTQVINLEENISLDTLSASQKIKPAWNDFRDFKVERVVIENKNKSVKSFYITPVDRKPLPIFNPGQYLTFCLNIEDRRMQIPKPIIRCYSLSQNPDPEYYRITIKKIVSPEDGHSGPVGIASGYFHELVNEGDILSVKAPSGRFYLDTERDDPVVLIGSGIGITPVLCMLNTCLINTPRREIWFYYGVRNSDEQIMKPYLEEIADKHENLHLHVCFSKPGKQDIMRKDYHHIGHIDISLLHETLPMKSCQFYICGPGQMMETVVPGLKAWGVAHGDIHYESFGPSSMARHEMQHISSDLIITFSKSDKTCRWSSRARSLLEFAETNGIPINSGCRAGSCGSCQTSIEAGEVEFTQLPDIDPESGMCLPCISIPKTNLTLSI